MVRRIKLSRECRSILEGLIPLACAITWMVFSLPQTARAAPNQKDLVPPAAPRYAIVVGIGAYPPESRLRPLHWTTNDARKLTTALQNIGFVVPTPLLDARATQTGIRAAIESVAAAMDPATKQSATIVMFFSGHGFGERTVNGTEQHNFLATYETDGRDLKGSGLAIDQLGRWLRATGAGRLLLILDACRNSPVGGKAADSPSWGRFESSEGMRILLSTRAGDYSWEDDNLKHGVFSKFLIAGLQGGHVMGKAI